MASEPLDLVERLEAMAAGWLCAGLPDADLPREAARKIKSLRAERDAEEACARLHAGLLREVALAIGNEPGDDRSTLPERVRAALDAALNLWPRDCRLCAHFTTQAGGCVSVVQCVDSMQFKATTPRQYWIAGPDARLSG